MTISLYDISNRFGREILNTGFNYKEEGIILKKTLSPYLFQNKVLNDFLVLSNNFVINNIESVKRIRIHNNFTVDKNITYIN